MKIPCKDCLLIPACRHKQFWKLVAECILIKDVIYEEGLSNMVQNELVNKIQAIIRPTKWGTLLNEENK